MDDEISLPESVITELQNISGVSAIGQYDFTGDITLYCDNMLSVSNSDVLNALLDSGISDISENDVRIRHVTTGISHDVGITVYINPELFR